MFRCPPVRLLIHMNSMPGSSYSHSTRKAERFFRSRNCFRFRALRKLRAFCFSSSRGAFSSTGSPSESLVPFSFLCIAGANKAMMMSQNMRYRIAGNVDQIYKNQKGIPFISLSLPYSASPSRAPHAPLKPPLHAFVRSALAFSISPISR